MIKKYKNIIIRKFFTIIQINQSQKSLNLDKLLLKKSSKQTKFISYSINLGF
jgi:hypothetical protein